MHAEVRFEMLLDHFPELFKVETSSDGLLVVSNPAHDSNDSYAEAMIDLALYVLNSARFVWHVCCVHVYVGAYFFFFKGAEQVVQM